MMKLLMLLLLLVSCNKNSGGGAPSSSSAGHKSNIEQPRYTHTGVAFKQTSGGTSYWTQIFFEKN